MSEKLWVSKLRLKTLELDTRIERRTVVPHIERLQKRGEADKMKSILLNGKTEKGRWSSPFLPGSATSPYTPKSFLLSKPFPFPVLAPSASSPRLRIAWSKFHPVSPRRNHTERSVLAPKWSRGLH